MGWEPLFKQLQDEHGGDVLHEGVPDWLWSSLFQWLNRYLKDQSGEPSPGLLRDIERRCRVALDWQYGAHSASKELSNQMVRDHELALEVVNLVLSQSNRVRSDGQRHAKLTFLEIAFRDSGSAWQVVDGDPPHLERRVSQETRDRYADVAKSGRPGEHLKIAWRTLYGRHPDPSTAYREAVKAIEAAAAPVISPEDDLATLGKMITAIGDKPEKWNVSLAADGEGAEVIRQMMAGVWRGQHDRHGTADEDRPLSVTPEEAEAAVHVAITLVHLFGSGLVTRT